ncbi:ABC transporter ATP-binding protein [Thalassotalea marina]|uniref:ABC transporter ATP-binding protein n=1 Tax=Thalassotalea marina TaxID=1673741 RepID=A0A919BF02_9GAMM|nr:ABC transporter ATP-binding protein [Thalassotalea marina]GHF84301.1 ABC transporter ATP-binding protein [Thalassotalea marina]
MLIAKGVGKCFKSRKTGDKWAVKDVNFTVQPGDMLALLGRNGAGKSTLMKLLAGIISPSTGTIELSGKLQGKVQLLTPAEHLYKELTVFETLDYFCTLYELSREDSAAAIGKVIEQFNLQDFIDKKVGSLSTGMKQRVSLAKTFLIDPPVIMLDEPTAGLDIESSFKLIETINQIRDLGKVIIVSTHNMSEANQIANRVLMLEQGSLVCDLKMQEFESSADSLESAYMNKLEVCNV